MRIEGKNAQVLLYDEYDLDLLDLEAFKQIVFEKHGERLDFFVRKYGKLDIDLLPDDFYIYINRIRFTRKK